MRNVPKHIIDQARQLPRHGSTFEDALNAASKAFDNVSGPANVAVAGIGKFIEYAEQLPKALKTAADATSWLEQRTNVLQKSFGLNVQSATEFYGRLAEISEEMGVGAQKLAKYSANLSSLVGAFANFKKAGSLNAYMKDMLQSQTILQENLGLTETQANKFSQYAAIQGKTSTEAIAQQQEIVNQIQSKLQYEITTKELMEDITSLSYDTMLHYGKMPANLALAVTKAKLLGISMDQLNKTGQNFLNIESSIGDELEYQLLSGRRLVNDKNQSLTNLYRQATIQGDASKQADLMNQIVEQEGDTIRDNLFARQQLAKTLGTDEATLAKMLGQQEILSKLQTQGMDMVGKTAEEIDAAIKNTTDQEKKDLLTQLKDSYDQRTTDERMLANSDIMVSTMLKAFGTPEQMSEFAATRSGNLLAASRDMKNVGTGVTLSPDDITTLGAAVVGSQAWKTVTEPVTNILTNFKDGLLAGVIKTLENATNSASTITIQGDSPVSINASSVSLDANSTSVDDIAMGPGAGRVILGPEGAFSLNNRDSIIAGTNLGGGSGADVTALAAAIVSAINNQTAELTRDNTYWS